MTKPTEYELFEQWAKNNEHMIDDYTYAFGIWLARAELADKEIAELNNRIKFLEKQHKENLLFIMQQKSQINELRKTLEEISSFNVDVRIKPIVKQALAKTAPQCLIEHDNDLIEKCAKVADTMPLNTDEIHKYRDSDDCKAMSWDISYAIRALKG